MTPERVLDTRNGVGLTGRFVSPTGRDLRVTGSVPTATGTRTVVPSGATAVVLNVTVVGPDADGFVSVRPAGTPGAPTTSNLNFTAGAIVPNAVTVALPTSGGRAGSIELLYDAFGVAGATTDLLVDVTGYYVAAGSGGATGPTAPTDPGSGGAVGVAPARVVWVATEGEGTFRSLSAALASITDNSASRPYLIRIAPGTYTETGPVQLKNHVDIEGSGQGTTTITCACGTAEIGGGTLNAGNITAELRHLSVVNTGGNAFSTAIATNGVVDGHVSMLHVTAAASGAGTQSRAILNSSSSPRLTNVTARASGAATTNHGIFNTSSSPTMSGVTVVASGASANFGVSNTSESAPIIRGSSISGAPIAVDNSQNSTARIADTTLTGSVSLFGFSCVGVHDADFAELSTTCRP